jgi:hypothetical protein
LYAHRPTARLWTGWRSASQLTCPKVRKQKAKSVRLLISKWEIFFFFRKWKCCFIKNKIIWSDVHTRLSLVCTNYFIPLVGRDGSVGIATRYGLDGPDIESQWGARFSTPVQAGSEAHPVSCTMGTGSFPGGKAAGAWRWPPTPSSADVKERVEPYLYSPSGPSWPVVGWTLLYFTLLYFYFIP